MKAIFLLAVTILLGSSSPGLRAVEPQPSAADLSRAILNRKLTNADRLAAAVEAGRRTLHECIPALISEIDKVQTDRVVNELQPLGVCYPCAGALIMIGSPSINPVKEAKQQPQSPLRANLLREVLFCLEGEGEGTRKAVEQYFSSFKPAAANDVPNVVLPANIVPLPPNLNLPSTFLSKNETATPTPPSAATSNLNGTQSNTPFFKGPWVVGLAIVMLLFAIRVIYAARKSSEKI